MKLLHYFASLGLMFFLGFIAIGPVASQGNDPLVRPEPPTLEVGQGQIETLTIVLENAHEVYGIDLRGKFDPTVAEIVDADPAGGVQLSPGTFPQPDFLVRNTADNAAGTFMYVVTQVNPTPSANGNGLIVSIQFRAKAAGGQSTFAIDFVDLVDREGRTLSAQTQNGTIRAVPPRPPTLALTPAPVAELTALPTIALLPGDSPQRSRQNNSPAFTPSGLALAAGGGLGALALLAIAAWVLRRSSKRN